jgi:hypothetical protein
MKTKIIPISEAPERKEPYRLLQNTEPALVSKMIEYPNGWMIRYKEYTPVPPEPLILKPPPSYYNGEKIEQEPIIIY